MGEVSRLWRGEVEDQAVPLQVYLSAGSVPGQCSFADNIVAVSPSKSWSVGPPPCQDPASFSVLLVFLLLQGSQTCPCWACWSTQLRWKPTEAVSTRSGWASHTGSVSIQREAGVLGMTSFSWGFARQTKPCSESSMDADTNE